MLTTDCRTLSRNAENQLSSTAYSGGRGTQVSSYRYDGNGGGVLRGDSSGVTHFVNRWYQVDDVAGTPATTVTYWHNGEQVASYDGTTKRWLQVDHLGSPAVATDSTGTLLWERREYPYGDTRIDTGAAGTERLFTGQVEDSDSSLYYYNTRYLETGIGRFISPDSIVPNPSDPRDHNRYAYVRNNPLKYTDPSGRAVCSYVGEFSDCDSIEDGSNYSFGKETNWAKARRYVEDGTLLEYESFIKLDIDAETAWERAVGPTGSTDQDVADAQQFWNEEWEERNTISFGEGPELVDENGKQINFDSPAVTVFATTALITGGSAQIAFGIGQGALGYATYRATGNPTVGLLALKGLINIYSGSKLITDGVCLSSGKCANLPSKWIFLP